MINKFKRVEIKYLLSSEEEKKLMNRINKYLEKDTYYQSTINNIYFDTDFSDLIVNSIEKPLFKQKVRLRSYGTPNFDSLIFFEIKNKYNGVVGKRRISFTLNDYYNYINNGIYDNNNQIMREIDYLIKHYNLSPKIFIAYDRLSYKGKFDDSVRITFDKNLRSRRVNLQLDYGSEGTNYFDDPTCIMEIKILGSMPLWLSKILNELKIYPKSFSKYGSIYKKECCVLC